MRSLFLRFFLAFWAAMVLVLSGTVVTTLWITYEQRADEREQQSQLAVEASEVLASDGSAGLRDWLVERTQKMVQERFPYRLYVLDRRGRDLLPRPVPEFLQAAVGGRPFPERGAEGRRRGPDERLFAKLTSAEGEDFYLSLSRFQQTGPWGIFGASPWAPVLTLLITVLVSAVVGFLLARFLSAPIQHLRAATRTIAGGNLEVQVAGLLGHRHDELAMLAVDFDAMAVRLRALLDARQQLLRDVSHELRSPLARLQIALGLARRPGANLQQELDRIEQDAGRLDELIGEILSLCRLDDPARPLQMEPVALDELLESVGENAAVEADARKVRVQLETTHAPEVPGNRELLFRAVENVLRNAIRFTPEGGTVTVRGGRAGAMGEILIQDQGPGVPAALLGRIFEPFFRVADARDRDSGGNGVGLAITERVLRTHGGTVVAENLPQGGLQVRMLVPLAPGTAGADA